MAGEYNMQAERQGYYQALEAMHTGTYKGSGDILDFTLWDRIVIDGTTPVLQHRLFVNGLGSTVGAVLKNLADTNVRGNQGIPQGQKLYVRAIKIFYQGQKVITEAITVNLYNMLQDTTINIEIPGKDTYGQWALDEVMGLSLQSLITPAVAGDNTPLFTLNRAVGVLPLNLPIVLASQVAFNVTLQHHAAPSTNLDDEKIKIGLTGILERLS